MLIAVSGGADSMCLMTMLAQWREHMQTQQSAHFHMTFEVATVNHGLRIEAADECAFVVEHAQKLSFNATSLEPLSDLDHRYQGKIPATGIQDWARQVRYQALNAHMQQHTINWLITAHTRNDHAETIMMRLSAGSGIRGLTGIKALTTRNQKILFRPFLTISKSQILATCQEYGIPFLDDPSNAQTRFARVRWRSMMPMLSEEGLTLKRLETFAKRCNDADEAITHYAKRLINSARMSGDDTRFDVQAWMHEPFAVICRAFELVLTSAYGLLFKMAQPDYRPYHLKLSRIEAFTQRYLRYMQSVTLHADSSKNVPLRLTLGGMLISVNTLGVMKITREPPRNRGRNNSI